MGSSSRSITEASAEVASVAESGAEVTRSIDLTVSKLDQSSEKIGSVIRLITRLIAIFPAVIVTAIYGQHGTAKLLVLSQVILSMQLSFAVIPLVMSTSDRHKMGESVNPAWLKILSWFVAIAIACLNAWLLFQSIWG